MIRRVTLGLALIGAAFAGLDCNQIFGLTKTELDRPNTHFAGCFQGPVTDPAGQGPLTLILVADPEATLSLEGCLRSTNPVFDATHAGFVRGSSTEDRIQALVTVMPLGRPAFALTVTREPATRHDDALTVSLTNASGFPFRSALNLPRCAAPTTCADLGIAVPFVSAPSGKAGRPTAVALAAGQ